MSRKYGMIDHDLVGDGVTDNSSKGNKFKLKETDINKLKAEWFARGQRQEREKQEREKMQAELRRLSGIDEFEEGG
jgi:hypothetical protein